MKSLNIVGAIYKEGYKILLTFSNGKKREVDFAEVLDAFAKGDYKK